MCRCRLLVPVAWGSPEGSVGSIFVCLTKCAKNSGYYLVPETVAPDAGDVMETVRGEFLTSELAVTPAQPAQSRANTKSKHNQGVAPGRALDLPMSSVRKLIESSCLSLAGRLTGVGPTPREFPTYVQANPRSGISLLNKKSVLVQGATCVVPFTEEEGRKNAEKKPNRR